jgi:hypothetical protein
MTLESPHSTIRWPRSVPQTHTATQWPCTDDTDLMLLKIHYQPYACRLPSLTKAGCRSSGAASRSCDTLRQRITPWQTRLHSQLSWSICESSPGAASHTDATVCLSRCKSLAKIAPATRGQVRSEAIAPQPHMVLIEQMQPLQPPYGVD